MSERLEAMSKRIDELKGTIHAVCQLAGLLTSQVEVLRSDVVVLSGERDDGGKMIDPLQAPEVTGADKDGDGGQTYTPRIELDE